MNKLFIKTSAFLLALAIIFPMSVSGQEKKVHIKKVKEVDGKKVVIDTVFVVTGDENEKEMIKEFVWVSDGDTNKTITLDIDADIDIDEEGNKTVIIYKGDGADDKNVFYFNGEDSDIDEDMIIEMHVTMDELRDNMEDIRIDLDEEKIIIIKELENIESLKELEHFELMDHLAELEELEELHELQNIEFIMSDMDFSPDHHEFWVEHHGNYHGKVSEKELRDAGIKVKANRLDLHDYDIDIDNGVVDVEFEIEGESSPKVTVFNFFGDKVISGKPEIAGGKYSIKMDLSTKQHGTYYLQITNKDSSITKKFSI